MWGQFNSIVLAIQRLLAYPSVPVVSTARAVPTGCHCYHSIVPGCVSISAGLDPWGPGAVETATRKVIPPGSVGLAQGPSTNETPGHEKLAFRWSWSSYGPPYPSGRWSSKRRFSFLARVKRCVYSASVVGEASDNRFYFACLVCVTSPHPCPPCGGGVSSALHRALIRESKPWPPLGGGFRAFNPASRCFSGLF